MPHPYTSPHSPLLKVAGTSLVALTLAGTLTLPAFAQGRGNGNGNGGNSGGSQSSSSQEGRGHGNSTRSDSTAATSSPAAATSTATGNAAATATPGAPAGAASATATRTPAPAAGDAEGRGDRGNGNGKDGKDEKGQGSDNHGGAVRAASEDARTGDDANRGREISEAARSALGKPEQAIVSLTGVLTSISATSATVLSGDGETVVAITPDTRIKTGDDSDASVDDLAALLAQGPVAVRVRGQRSADGFTARRIEVRGDADDLTVSLDGVVNTVGASSFTLVTRASATETGTVTTTSSGSPEFGGTPTPAPTVTATATASPTAAATGTPGASATPAGTPAGAGSTYTIAVTADTIIRRNDAPATLADLKPGDEVEARGALDGSTLTASRVVADGPAASGTPAAGGTPAATGTPGASPTPLAATATAPAATATRAA